MSLTILAKQVKFGCSCQPFFFLAKCFLFQLRRCAHFTIHAAVRDRKTERVREREGNLIRRNLVHTVLTRRHCIAQWCVFQ